MKWQEPHELIHRSGAGRVVIVGLIGALALAFFRVQVLQSDRFQLLSEGNRLRAVPILSPRGLITDRNGVVLAENVPGYSVALLASSSESLTVTLDRIAPIVRTDSATRTAILARHARMPSEPVMVLRDAPLDAVSALEEERPWNPGLVIQSDPKRRYPFGQVTAHLVGYVGEITESELRTRTARSARGGSLVGRDGLEQEYDERLQGQDGVTYVEVDALGRTVREAGGGPALDPRPGETIRTTVDIELQRFVADAFPQDSRGAVVALDPRTGEILALYSAPSYDPNVFIGGVDPAVWRDLSAREDSPLFNRATQGRYPPASPWKLAVAAAALGRGLVTMDSRMSYPCRGGFQYGNRYFRCWRLEGHGDLTLTEAIQYSCDVYFYQLGLKLGLSALLHDGTELGFGDPSGIDLPGERRSLFPPSTEYFNQRYGPRGWTNAVTLNLSIGQGENAQTLINMVRFYAMLANPSGVAPEPRLVQVGQGRSRRLGLAPEALAGLREALELVVERGTAAGAQIANLRIAGKTGTAQNAHGPDHGWFIGFAPADDPQIVVGAIVEFAEHGSRVAPLVTRVIARHLLGPDALAVRAGAGAISMPSDSAPEPIPILPDTALLQPARPDTARATPRRIR
jgi:penicillin-binding protein 2